MKFIFSLDTDYTSKQFIVSIKRCQKTYPKHLSIYYRKWGYVAVIKKSSNIYELVGVFIPDFTHNRKVKISSATLISDPSIDVRGYIYNYTDYKIPKNLFRNFTKSYKAYVLPYLKENIKL